MRDIFLSIITINYNNSKGLEKTIESVVSQSCRDFEYIIIDGGSLDASVNVIKKFSDRINYWVSEKDTGIFNAMNKGIEIARGEYILFVNSGDMLVNNQILEEVKPYLSDAEIIYGDYEVVAPDKKWIKEYPDVLSFSHFKHDSLAHSAAAFTKRTAFRGELSRYDETLKVVPDWKWYLIGIFKYNYSYRHINKVIGVFDFSGNSATNPELTAKEKQQVFRDDFREIYKELTTLSTYKNKYEAFQNSRYIRFYLKLKKLISGKQLKKTSP
jgi:glycosyltransferase involved in cell wall biosynthesis